jgi:oligopeptide/dipeptide ABC transporter ATP-binding protein
MSLPLLQVDELSVSYELPGLFGTRRHLQALDEVSLTLNRREALAVIGESGSGKSTLARALMRLTPFDGGMISYRGEPYETMDGEQRRDLPRRIQMVFQNPQGAFNPRWRIGAAVSEPLRLFRRRVKRDQRQALTLAMMQRVGLGPEHLRAFPHQLSGGQAQRAAIARALVSGPDVLICDEPLSALDVSVKAQLSNLLKALQRDAGLAMVFVSHDLPAVRFLCDRVLVLYLGRVMEIADTETFFTRPRHPYSRALLKSQPTLRPGEGAESLPGEIPSPFAPPPGCVFHTRCPMAIARCTSERPELRDVEGIQVACHRAEEAPI